MLYQPYEIEISQRYLKSVLSAAKEPICILGAWAVYMTVNESFSRDQGRNYLGSRDIDLGFHLNENATEKELRNSDFNSVIQVLERSGFEFVGFRLVKHFHTETRRELKGAEARKTPSYETFELYVDPIVDAVPKLSKKVFGFVPIDEPMLSRVFIQKEAKTTALFGKRVLLPLPKVLLAAKIKSVVSRDKEYKRIKDIADIYALAWYSKVKLYELMTELSSIVPKKEVSSTLRAFKKEELARASMALGVDAVQVQRVMDELTSA